MYMRVSAGVSSTDTLNELNKRERRLHGVVREIQGNDLDKNFLV